MGKLLRDCSTGHKPSLESIQDFLWPGGGFLASGSCMLAKKGKEELVRDNARGDGW